MIKNYRNRLDFEQSIYLTLNFATALASPHEACRMRGKADNNIGVSAKSFAFRYTSCWLLSFWQQ